jgi:hypothetical protein
MTRTIPVLAVLALLLASPIALNSAPPPAAAQTMADAANAFLKELNPEQKSKATFAFEDDSRFEFRYTPRARTGLPIKEMTEVQRAKAHALLKTGLSMRGYTTATTIMDLETILHAIENSGGRVGKQTRDPELYFFTIFGTPSAKSPWGWRVEGHHVSLHFSVANNTAVTSTPSFFGSNPAEVREEGPKKGLRVLGPMEDSARALLETLDDAQKKSALIADVAPTEIVTNTQLKFDPLTPVGIAAADLKPAQRDLLTKVLESFTSQMADDIGAERLAKIRQAGFEKVTFAWSGPLERGKQHYYRIQGPTFLVEYDNSQNNGNHVHSVWRDFAGDFGRDLLREHIKSVAH